MTTVALDTLDFANKLKAGGFSEQQAETQARALADVLEKQIATKEEAIQHENLLRRDIEGLRVELKHDLDVLRIEAKRDLKETELRLEARFAETNTRIAETKADLTRWVIGAGLLQTTIIIGVLMKVAKLI